MTQRAERARGEGNWVGRSVSQETVSITFNFAGIYCIFASLLHQNCLMAEVGSAVAAVISPKDSEG